jgi:hypothetical protein
MGEQGAQDAYSFTVDRIPGYLNSNPIYLCAMFCKTMCWVFMQYAFEIVVVFDILIIFINQKIHHSPSHKRWYM